MAEFSVTDTNKSGFAQEDLLRGLPAQTGPLHCEPDGEMRLLSRRAGVHIDFHAHWHFHNSWGLPGHFGLLAHWGRDFEFSSMTRLTWSFGPVPSNFRQERHKFVTWPTMCAAHQYLSSFLRRCEKLRFREKVLYVHTCHSQFVANNDAATARFFMPT